MQVTLEELIRSVVRAVVNELRRSGITVVSAGERTKESLSAKTERPDLSDLRSPVLTEARVNGLHELTGTVAVPRGTIVTPRARELLREKKINIIQE